MPTVSLLERTASLRMVPTRTAARAFSAEARARVACNDAKPNPPTQNSTGSQTTTIKATPTHLIQRRIVGGSSESRAGFKGRYGYV